MSAIVDAFLAELDDHTLDQLAQMLAPRLTSVLAARPASEKEAAPWLRGAEEIAAYIGAPRSRVYSLVSAGRIPVHRDGSNLVARTDELDAWIRGGGGRRP